MTTPQPQANVVDLPGAGWITGDSKSVYVIGTNGVVKVDPADPTQQTPVSGITAVPVRIQLVGDILWTATYGPPAAGVRVGTIEGFDLAHPGKHTVPVTFKAPATGAYITKLVDIDNTFWLTAVGPDGKPGLEPFTITG